MKNTLDVMDMTTSSDPFQNDHCFGGCIGQNFNKLLDGRMPARDWNVQTLLCHARLHQEINQADADQLN